MSESVEMSNSNLYRHDKTGNVYRFIARAIDATNAREGNDVIVYKRNGITFVRDAGEWVEKFTPIGHTDSEAES